MRICVIRLNLKSLEQSLITCTLFVKNLKAPRVYFLKKKLQREGIATIIRIFIEESEVLKAIITQALGIALQRENNSRRHCQSCRQES